MYYPKTCSFCFTLLTSCTHNPTNIKIHCPICDKGHKWYKSIVMIVGSWLSLLVGSYVNVCAVGLWEIMEKYCELCYELLWDNNSRRHYHQYGSGTIVWIEPLEWDIVLDATRYIIDGIGEDIKYVNTGQTVIIIHICLEYVGNEIL